VQTHLSFSLLIYSRLKSPSDFSFFKVTEYEATQTVKELQEYVNQASKVELQDLKQYEVSIDRVEAHQTNLQLPLTLEQWSAQWT
jgi:DNA/RNA endonuclease G (NUC1)